MPGQGESGRGRHVKDIAGNDGEGRSDERGRRCPGVESYLLGACKSVPLARPLAERDSAQHGQVEEVV